MLRRVDYRIAINLFVFTGLWFVIGAIVLWSPVPGALGIGGGLFVMWLLMFFAVLAVAGSALTLAAINSAFPAADSAEASAALRERTIERAKSAVPRLSVTQNTGMPATTASPPSPPPPSPPRTRKPARAPLWAPSEPDASASENAPPAQAMDPPSQTRRPQRGDV